MKASGKKAVNQNRYADTLNVVKVRKVAEKRAQTKKKLSDAKRLKRKQSSRTVTPGEELQHEHVVAADEMAHNAATVFSFLKFKNRNGTFS
ncbi:hypothetical protein LSAT2_019543 [Lamellibrachia satsuma]|nr:hypothetical protein LSAT2_019543 [Lamellibrachia satsuma]